jgi:hypothetical protein
MCLVAIGHIGSDTVPKQRLWVGLRWVLLGLLFVSTVVATETLRCPAGRVLVNAADLRDAEMVCEGASDAVRFLEGVGLDVGIEVVIHIVEQLPEAAGPNAAGCYVHAEGCVYAMSCAIFTRQSAAHGGPVSQIPYRSLITHEVAHAIADHNFTVSRPTIQAHEYIAAVTTFAAMPPLLRTRILGSLPGDGFDAEEQISATLFLLAPHWFGAQAYRHYNLPGNGPAFLRKVLTGDALSEQRGL